MLEKAWKWQEDKRTHKICFHSDKMQVMFGVKSLDLSKRLTKQERESEFEMVKHIMYKNPKIYFICTKFCSWN